MPPQHILPLASQWPFWQKGAGGGVGGAGDGGAGGGVGCVGGVYTHVAGGGMTQSWSSAFAHTRDAAAAQHCPEQPALSSHTLHVPAQHTLPLLSHVPCFFVTLLFVQYSVPGGGGVGGGEGGALPQPEHCLHEVPQLQ